LPKKKSGNRGSPSGRLRIVAGKWRSRLLPVADVEGLRPTSERVRETLFNWLSPHIEGARCLDLFAGTGALGFEALSRGAASVMFVEQSRTAASMLRDNADRLESKAAEILASDAYAFAARRNRNARMDIVFLDPPFADDRYEELCRLLDEGGWLAPGALVYLEQDRKQSIPALPAGWRVKKEKTAGNVRYSLIEATT
jgi:16S rRNA (guanine966-N2)-methyltransferase